MKPIMSLERLGPGAALIFIAFLGLCACDRVFTEGSDEEPDDVLQIGTFKAQAGEKSNQGFEALEGPATFELLSRIGVSQVVVLRLTSQLPNFEEPTTLDFVMTTQEIPGEGTYGIGQPNTESNAYFVACFRSPNFSETPYESESGEFVIKTSAAGVLEGTFEMTAYALVSTGPTSNERVRLEISGSLNARSGTTSAQPDAVFECVPD